MKVGERQQSKRKGRLIHADEISMMVTARADKAHGFGILVTWMAQSNEGEWKEDKQHGKVLRHA